MFIGQSTKEWSQCRQEEKKSALLKENDIDEDMVKLPSGNPQI